MDVLELFSAIFYNGAQTECTYKTYIQTMKNGTVAPPCVKFHVEIPSAVEEKTLPYHKPGRVITKSQS